MKTRVFQKVPLSTVAALTAFILPALPSSAQVGYVYQPLSQTGYSGVDVYGVTGGFAVGFGYATADGQPHPVAWNLSDGTSFRLDENGLTTPYIYGATNGYAVGYANFPYQAFAWNLSTGVRTQLSGSQYTQATGAGSGYAWGSDSSSANPTIWNVATNTKITLTGNNLDGSTVTGVSGNKAVGYTHPYGTDTSTYSAAVWDITTGGRTSLSGAYSQARGATNGYAVGTAGSSPYDAVPVKWNLATGTRTNLDNSGLYNNYVNGAGYGFAFGYGSGDATNYANHALLWNLDSNLRTDLQAVYMPANRVGSAITAIDEQNGNMVGREPNTVGGLFALVSINTATATTVAAGGTATVTGNFAQSNGTAQINGTFRFSGGAGANTYTLSSGMLQGVGTLQGNLANTGGTVAPGNSPGTLTITGNFAQAAGGTLAIELGTPAFDVLKVGGTANLSGALAVQALTGLTPVAGQTWDILSLTGTGTITGVFNAVTPGYTFGVVNGGKTGRLTFTGAVAVPELGTFALLLPTFGIAFATARRRG